MAELDWKLGEDLRTYDSLLDGITFDELILQVHCNLPKQKINAANVRKELHELLSMRLDDMDFLLDQNIDTIISYARDNYRDE